MRNKIASIEPDEYMFICFGDIVENLGEKGRQRERQRERQTDRQSVCVGVCVCMCVCVCVCSQFHS